MRSVVFQRNGIRRDVHLRLVLGDLDVAGLAAHRRTQLDAALVARTVEPCHDGVVTAWAGEGFGGVRDQFHDLPTVVVGARRWDSFGRWPTHTTATATSGTR